MRDAVAGGFATHRVDFVPHGVEPGFDRELCDPRAHRAQADDADGADHSRSTTPAIAMPNPTHIDATP